MSLKPFIRPVKPMKAPIGGAAKAGLKTAAGLGGVYAYHAPGKVNPRMERPRGGKGPRNQGE